MRRVKRILLISGIMLVVFMLVAVIRTCTMESKQVKDVRETEYINLEDDLIVSHLSHALQFRTISYTEPSMFDYGEFLKLHKYIEQSYPNINSKLKKEVVNQYSLLYTWEGTDKSLKPVMLTAHLDVVGIEDKTEAEWKHKPFSGDIDDGKIWGRGARDNKCQMMSILEAVEYLIDNNFTPSRTIYIAFGHDEEVLGINGAAYIGRLLHERGVKPECVIDEGGTIIDKAVPGIDGKTALIGIGEKGYLTVELSVEEKGGHSSTPPQNTSIGILSNAIVRLENNKFNSTLVGIKPTLEFAAAEMKFPFNTIAANLWATGGIVKRLMSSSPDTNAGIRTTGVVTLYEGGFKDNVIPAYAGATANFRLIPGDTVEKVLSEVEGIIDDKRVNISVKGFSNNPPPISSVDTESFKKIQTSIKQVFPDTISVPYFVTGGTDCKHYANLTPNLYRFTPSIKEKDEISHGINERITVDNYKQYISFFIQLIKNFQSK